MRFAFVVLALVLIGCQTTALPQPAAPQADMAGRQGEFVAFFRLAFFTDGETGGLIDVPLFRRNQPITVSFTGDDRPIRPLVEQYMQELRELSGVPYRYVSAPTYTRRGDLIIHIDGLKSVRALARERGLGPRIDCFAWTFFGDSRADGVQTATEVWISSDLPDKHLQCVSEELSHAFGLTGDGILGVRSAFSAYNTTADHRLTAWDRAALWLLYHPDLRPGMMWDEAEPIVRRIVKETWG